MLNRFWCPIFLSVVPIGWLWVAPKLALAMQSLDHPHSDDAKLTLVPTPQVEITSLFKEQAAVQTEVDPLAEDSLEQVALPTEVNAVAEDPSEQVALETELSPFPEKQSATQPLPRQPIGTTPLAQQPISVSELSDIVPTDWYYQAVRTLVERYQCLAGYPDGTFRGNRPVTRAELATALNHCLENMGGLAHREDLETIRALQDEFAAELASLRGQVDTLEARVATVAAQQFSTTTKLVGEAVLGFGGVTGDVADGTGAGTDIDSRVSFTQRTRLQFISSFSGRDRLFIRLQSQNRPINFSDGTPPFLSTTGTPSTRVAFDTGDDDNEFTLNRLDYKFPIGSDLDVTVFANAGLHNFYATTLNPYFDGPAGARGSISWFGGRHPIYRIGTIGVSATGVGTTYTPTKNLRIDAGYLATNGQSPVAVALPNGFEDGGLVGGGYSALAQVSYQPYDRGQVGLTYIRNFAPDGNLRHGAGSPASNVPFAGAPLTGDSIGLAGSFGIGDRVAVGGWFGYTFANQVNSSPNNAEILNAALNLAVFDVGKEGATAGLIFGLPPHVVDNDFATSEDPDTPFHIELNYQFPVNQHISVTPGVFYLVNPNGNSDNGDILVGIIRTTFRF